MCTPFTLCAFVFIEQFDTRGVYRLQSHLTEPEVTKNGIGVGHGLNGELLTELRVLLNTECGHWGGPMCTPPDAFPLLEERPFRQGILDHPLISLPDIPENKYYYRTLANNFKLFSDLFEIPRRILPLRPRPVNISQDIPLNISLKREQSLTHRFEWNSVNL